MGTRFSLRSIFNKQAKNSIKKINGMDLTTLAEQLKTQATNNNSIVLDQTLLSSDQLKQISLGFMLGDDKNLTIEGVTPSDIPAPQDDSLTIEVGTSSLLNQKSVPTKLIFTINDNKAQVLIAAKMSASWAFKDSFPNLVQFPFSNLTLTDTYFIYAPAHQSSYQPWSDKPQETITLEAGLNFAAWLTLDGFSSILTLLTDIIGADTSYKFFGPFTPTADAKYPVGTLSSLLSTKDFFIGYDPLLLRISNPTFVTQISKPEKLIQDIDLELQGMSSLGLDFSLGISSTGDSLTFGATPIAGEPFTADKIMQLPGGGDFQSFIPSELENIFKEVGLKYFTLVMLTKTQKVGYIELSIGTVEPWDVLPNVIKLENIVLMLNMSNPSGSNSLTAVSLVATAQILPNLFTGDFTFAISIQKANQRQWQVTSIRGQYIGIIKLSDIVNVILGSVTSVPAELNDVSFSDFGVSVDKTNNSYVCYGNCEFSLPLLGSELNSILSINVYYSSNAYTVVLVGVLSIGEQIFDLELDFSKQQGAQDIKLTASWKAQDKAYLKLEDIASAFNLELPKIPEGLDLALESASLTYDFTNKTLVIEAASANLGNAVFVAFKNTTTAKWQFYFGLTVGQLINLSKLPLVGTAFPPEQSVGVKDLQILIASKDFTRQEITAFNNLIGGNGTKIPELPTDNNLSTSNEATIALPKGLNVAAQMQFGSITTPLALPVSAATQPTPPNQPPLPAPTSTSTSDNATWFKLQKSFGPVHFERVGVQYKDAVIWFLLDAALSAAGLTLSLEGLSVGSPLSKFEPKFNLRGLGLDYQSGPIEIGGAFLKGKITFQGKEYDDYSGTAIIRTETLTLAAIGSYVQLDIGPSMFVYAVLDYPIGGPAFFFVRGLAAGFGYNRLLHLPPVDQIDTFPLVQEAVGGLAGTPNLADELAKLQRYIPPSVGNYFLAIGIRFTSFEMLDSFILVTATFGHRFELDVVGLSTLVLPTPDASNAGVTPIAEVQLALRASFIPDDGFFGISAQLTNNSFLFDRKCHLTGGFAFYTWFAGTYEGDFVLTVGGYHPQFSPPSHYPTVPRLGFNWQVDDHLMLKGSAYYALTPSALMAGASLNATWQDGNLRAWFDAAINFLISWKPYHYTADFHVSIGASYTFHLFGTHHITAHVGADVSIWGPEFTGHAHVDLSVISFTIRFGSSGRNQIEPIKWDTFRQSFLPDDNAKICTINVKAGLTNKAAAKDSTDATTQSDSNNLGVVNAKIFCLTTDSVIPAQQVYRGEQGQNVLERAGATVAFNIGTMQLSNDQIISTQRIIITRNGISVEEQFDFHPLTKNAPAALWGSQLQPSLNGDQLINNLLTGYEIRAKRLDDAPHTKPIDYAALQEAATLDREPDAFRWSSLIPFVPQGADDAARRETIHNTLYNNDVAGRRAAIASALLGDDRLNLANFSADDFLSAPQVNELIAR
jgi:hypothetical protein